MRIALLLPCFLLLNYGYAQPKGREWGLGLGYGGILAHNQLVKHLAQSHPWQLNLEYLPEGEKTTAGIGLHYIDYQSQRLGRSLAALAFFEPKISHRFFLRIGSGIAWNSHPFQPETNPGNNMLGSRFSGTMQGRIFSRWNPGRLDLKLGIGLTHLSNGAWSLPNMGINHFYLYSSLGYSGKPAAAPGPAAEAERHSGAVFGLAASASLVERYPLTGRKYPVWQLQARAGYQNRRKSVFSLGADIMYNSAAASRLKEEPEEGSSALLTGIILGHTWQVLPKWEILTEAGGYLRRPAALYPAIYQRYGFRYRIFNGFSAGLLLKTHAARAECLELNLSCLRLP